MRFCLWNARSLANKFSIFQSFIYSLEPSIIAVSETWLSSYHLDGEILPSRYSIFRKDRNSRGGGVLLAVEQTLAVSPLPSPPDLEVSTIKLNFPKPVVVCVVYLPPLSNNSTFTHLLSYLHQLFSSNESVFVVGDFNCPDIDWSIINGASPSSSALCDLVFDLNISQIVESPTHVKGNTLDLVLTNSAHLVTSIDVLSDKFQYSDHFLIDFSFRVNSTGPATTVSPSKSILDFSKADFESMCNLLHDFDFSVLYDSTDVEVIWQLLKSSIHEAISLCTPTFRHSQSKHPLWFTSDIRHQINRVHTLRRKFTSSGSQSHFNQLASLESQLQENISASRTNYESRLVHDYSHSNSSRIFRYIKSFLKHDLFPPMMFFNEEVASSDQHKAELFNQFFFSVYSQKLPNVAMPSASPPADVLCSIDITVQDVYDTLIL